MSSAKWRPFCLGLSVLKLIFPMCRIYASVNLVSVGSDNVLSSIRRQSIIYMTSLNVKFVKHWAFTAFYKDPMAHSYDASHHQFSDFRSFQQIWMKFLLLCH